MSKGQGFRVNFSVPELSKAINQINAYDGRTAAKVEKAVQISTRNIAKGARRRVPVRSGDLQKSITSRFDSKSITGYVAARKPYAHLVEFGAKGTSEKPETKKALQIPFNGMGVEGSNFAKNAQIPQRKEHPYMRPSFEDEKPNLIRGVTEAIKP